MVALVGCKTSQPTQTTVATYTEDLSVHRPVIEKKTELPQLQEAVEPKGHIGAELDSITNMVIRRNAKPRIEQGFTIQIYNGSSREEATLALGNIRVKFPDLEAEMIYFQPDFRVKAGQFLDRVVAYKIFEEVKIEFADALLIPEKIRINYD